MKLGIDSYSFHLQLAAGRYDVFRTLDWVAAHRLAGIQLNINGPHGRFLGADPSDAAHVNRVRHRAAELGLFLEVGGAHITDAPLIAQQLHLAAALGADTLRTVVGYHDSLAATIARAQAAIDQLLPLARQLGVRIAIENHEDVTAGELRALLDAVDDPLIGACIDTGNDLVVYGDPLSAARQLAPHALSTHIKDQKLVRVGDTVHSVGVPLGSGDIDLPAILEVIRRETTLDRLLIQDTTGYSARLNPFHRPDLGPAGSTTAVLPRATPAELLAAGHPLQLDALTSAELGALAEKQEAQLERDIACISRLLA